MDDSQSLVSASGLKEEEPLKESGPQAIGSEIECDSIDPGASCKCSESEEEQKSEEEMCSERELSFEEEGKTCNANENGWSPLHISALQGDVETLSELIGRGADTRLRDQRGRTPLHLALYCRDHCAKEAASELLVEADCSNDIQDESGSTPLHVAAWIGCVKTVMKLLAGGARTLVQDNQGRTPLHRALCFTLRCKEKTTAELLVEGNCINDVQDELGMTPLHLAVQLGSVKIIRNLLAGGSRTRVQDKYGRTPLLLALYWDKEVAAELLAEADNSNIIRDKYRRTPLHLAAEKGFIGVVRTFIQNGTNPHVKNSSGEFPIQLALRGCRNENIPKILLSMYALQDIVIDWEELKLGENHLQFCIEELSRCYAEIQLMKHMQVPATSISHHHVVTRHVGWVASRLRIESVREISRSDRARLNFPIYAELIDFKLRTAEKRRVWMDQCLECFSLLSPPLPPTCTDIVMLCLSDNDIGNFVHAVQLESFTCSPERGAQVALSEEPLEL